MKADAGMTAHERAELHWAAWHTSEMNAEEVLCLIATEFQWKLPSGLSVRTPSKQGRSK